mgnify:CR=1 FL=1
MEEARKLNPDKGKHTIFDFKLQIFLRNKVLFLRGKKNEKVKD